LNRVGDEKSAVVVRLDHALAAAFFNFTQWVAFRANQSELGPFDFSQRGPTARLA
jgi:hypothetical protein